MSRTRETAEIEPTSSMKVTLIMGVLKFSIQKLKKKIQKIPRNDVDLKEIAKKFHTDDVLPPRSASDWSCREKNLLQPIRSTTQIWVVNRHQDEISAPVPQISFRE